MNNNWKKIDKKKDNSTCISYFSFSSFAVGVPLLSCTTLFTSAQFFYVIQDRIIHVAKFLKNFRAAQLTVYFFQCEKLLRVSHPHQQFDCAVWDLALLRIPNEGRATQSHVKQYVYKTRV